LGKILRIKTRAFCVEIGLTVFTAGNSKKPNSSSLKPKLDLALPITYPCQSYDWWLRLVNSACGSRKPPHLCVGSLTCRQSLAISKVR
jgi:hypothetical protein